MSLPARRVAANCQQGEWSTWRTGCYPARQIEELSHALVGDLVPTLTPRRMQGEVVERAGPDIARVNRPVRGRVRPRAPPTTLSFDVVWAARGRSTGDSAGLSRAGAELDGQRPPNVEPVR